MRPEQELLNRVARVPPKSMNFLPKANRCGVDKKQFGAVHFPMLQLKQVLETSVVFMLRRRKLTVGNMYLAYVNGADQFTNDPRYPTLREVFAVAEQPYAIMSKVARTHSEVTFWCGSAHTCA